MSSKSPSLLRPAAFLAALLAGAAGHAQQTAAPAAPPAPTADSTTTPPTAPSQGVSWVGAEPPAPEALAAHPEQFETLLADNGLALDVAARTVAARGGTLHDRTTLAYPIEYVIVTERGRTHEALFIIKAQPSLLDACLRAVGLRPGTPMRFRPRVPPPTDAEMDEGASPWDPVPSSGPLVDISVAWTDDAGRPQSRSLESMLIDVRNDQPLPERDWVYTGSRFGSMRQGKQVVQAFVADLQGDVVALYLTGDGACLLERNSLDGMDDTLYSINGEGMPPRGTPITITFKPTGKDVAPAPPQADAPVVAGALAQALDSDVTARAGQGFAGAVLVERGSDVVLHKGYGLADRAAGTPVTTASVFALGGVSDLFIATAILQLEQAGRLKRDEVIARYLANVPDDKAGVTVRQLLDHTSGWTVPAGADTVDRVEALQALLAAPLGPRPTQPTDAARAAENALLIAMVENTSGERWGDYLGEHVFGPAAMLQTGLFGELRWDRAQIVVDAADGAVVQKPPTWLVLGRGALLAPVSDLYRWERAARAGSLVSHELTAELLGEADGLPGIWFAEGVDRAAGTANAGHAYWVRCSTEPPASVMVCSTDAACRAVGVALASGIHAAPAAPPAAPEPPAAGAEPHDGR